MWLALALQPMLAQADSSQAESRAVLPMPHLVSLVGVGGQLHLTREDRLDQGRVAPGYVDVLVAYAWPLPGDLHVGPALGASSNITGDGRYAEPVFPFQQWALMPAVWAARGLHSDLPLFGHVGVPLVLEAPTALPGDDGSVDLGSGGIEVGAGVGYRWLAGVLTYVELDLNLWRGQFGSNLNTALELGIAIDYEVLP